MGGLHLKLWVVFLVLNQVFAHGLAGSVLVRCETLDGRETTQIAHHQTCSCGGHGPATSLLNRDTPTGPAIFHSGHCTDAPLDSTLVTRQNTQTFQVDTGVTALLWIIDVPDAIKATSPAPPPHLSPDSAESLARNTILLI